MWMGVLFAALAVLCGVAVNRLARAPLSLAPLTGLAAIVVVTSWGSRLGTPPMLGTLGILALALCGVLVALRDGAQRRDSQRQGRVGVAQPVRAMRQEGFGLAQLARAMRLDGFGLAQLARTVRQERFGVGQVTRAAWQERVTLGLLAAAVAIPIGLLGAALASVDAPVSTHDGAFHVETIDNLRRGVPIDGWYPMGFHASAAAVLRLVPWLDTARGTAEVTQALAMLAPLGIFAFGRGLGLGKRLSATGALILALTYIYPYDDHMWAGWPLATSILLLLGLWSIGAHWIHEPRASLAVLGGVIAGAILLTHGTEVYSSVIGLAAIAAVNWRRIRLEKLVWHLPLAVLGAVVCALPYLSTLVGWAAAGGATSAAAVEQASAQGQGVSSGGDWLELALGLTGAGGLIDLPVRAVLLVIGARQRRLRTAVVGWGVFGALLFAVSFLDIEPIRRLYTLTFPWLVHHRPPQLVVLFGSLLVGAGLVAAVRWFWSLRPRLASRPGAWRRLAMVGGALLFFLVEGSMVTIFKTLDAVIAEQNVYSSDDRAAMSWLRANAAPGEIVINDAAADAGIWAPYKAGLAVLMPRSGSGAEVAAREPILNNLLKLDESPGAMASACALRAEYVFAGSRRVAEDATALPERAQLEQAADLQQVFAQGDTAVFRLNLPCGR
jgi:hypothetical protein